MFPLALLNASSPPSPPDPVLTLALLHFDGADGSTTFTDSSSFANTFTTSGSPAVSTLQSKFGGSSLQTNGSVFEKILCQRNDGFWNLGNSDFTVECWFYQNSTSSEVRGLFYCQGDSGTKPFAALVENSVLKGQIQLQTGGSVLQTLAHQTTVTAATWHHMALVRKNGIVTLYLDGVASTSTLNVATDNLRTGALWLYVGGASNGLGNLDYSMNGYQDEFRLRKEAMYLVDFTPPTAPFTY